MGQYLHTLLNTWRSSMAISWIHQGRVFLMLMLVGTVSGMDPGSSSMSVQLSMLGSQLSTLWLQLIQLQEQVEVLQQQHIQDKERIQLQEQVSVLQQQHIQDKERLERRVSLLESVCGE